MSKQTTQPIGDPVEILLVEDNPGDVRLAQEALEDGKVRNHLNVVRDGMEAMDFLYKRGAYSDVKRPDIILLDLNLPRKDGREVLEEIKSNEDLRKIPVVVLTTSDAEKDILRAYDLSVNCYVTKPVDFNQFIDIIKKVEEFWLTIVKLP